REGDARDGARPRRRSRGRLRLRLLARGVHLRLLLAYELGALLLVDVVAPGLGVVLALLWIVSAEEAVVEGILLADQERCVGVVAHIVAVNQVVLDHVTNQAAEEPHV